MKTHGSLKLLLFVLLYLLRQESALDKVGQIPKTEWARWSNNFRATR